ncbi:uncharacterized protein WM277_016501 [Molossus nigricans]
MEQMRREEMKGGESGVGILAGMNATDKDSNYSVVLPGDPGLGSGDPAALSNRAALHRSHGRILQHSDLTSAARIRCERVSEKKLDVKWSREFACRLKFLIHALKGKRWLCLLFSFR